MRFAQDYSGITPIASGDFVLPAEDTYQAMIVKTEGKRSNDGDPQVVVTYKLLHGEQTGNTHAGKTILEYRTFKPEPKHKGFNMHFLHVIGQPFEGKFQIDSDAWLNAQLYIKVKHKEYNGKMYANAVGHMPLEAETPEADFKNS